MDVERIRTLRLILLSLYKMQRKYGYVSGTVCWFAIMWVIELVTVLSVYWIISNLAR